MDIFKPILKLVWSSAQVNDKKRIERQIKPEGLEEVCDIAYIDDGERGHLLDVYYPKNTTEKLPVIIDVHGGGWLYGYKDINKYYCMELAKRGFCVFNISYRLAMSKDVLLFDQIQDIFAAYKWIGENCEKYHGDINNIFLTGDSAGGHFVCLSSAINISDSLKSEYDLPDTGIDFKCVGATSPAIDLLSPNVILNVNLKSLLTEPIKESSCYKLMDFKNIVSVNLPPFFVCTSSGDFLHSQSIKLDALLRSYAVECKLEDFQHKVNGKRLPHVFSVLEPFSGPSIKVIDDMTSFFKAHM